MRIPSFVFVLKYIYFEMEEVEVVIARAVAFTKGVYEVNWNFGSWPACLHLLLLLVVHIVHHCLSSSPSVASHCLTECPASRRTHHEATQQIEEGDPLLDSFIPSILSFGAYSILITVPPRKDVFPHRQHFAIPAIKLSKGNQGNLGPFAFSCQTPRQRKQYLERCRASHKAPSLPNPRALLQSARP